MKGNQIILTCSSPEELIELFRPMLREELSKLTAEKEDMLLSPAETCKKFEPNISKNTLSTWTKLGYIDEIRKGGRIYYKLSEILKQSKTLRKYGNKQDSLLAMKII